MTSIRFDKSLPEELRLGMEEIRIDFPERFSDKGRLVKFRKNVGMARAENHIKHEEYEIIIIYGGLIGAFRALGRLMGALAVNGVYKAKEVPDFDMAGVMLDVSRNSVLKISTLKWYCRRFALMGINTLMLYTEDTYEVPEEPLIGYLRGGYRQAELREIDAYANQLGIEIIPCMQTLGHMEQVLQWQKTQKYADTDSILCIRDEATYALIERCIKALSSCVRSKRIHIGMDEAVGIGSGAFRSKYGEVPCYSIMTEHLTRVSEICRNEGLAPMIWSDMFFRLGSKNHQYYDLDWEISQDVVRDIPADVQLVYWDYYHTQISHYEKFIDFHNTLGRKPVVAGSVWTWQRLWCGMPYSLRATDACLAACRNRHVREVFITMWGDDGAECDFVSALPSLQHFSELIFSAEVSPQTRDCDLFGSCGFDYADWARSCELDTNSFFQDCEEGPSSISKTILWQDPLLPLFEAYTRNKTVNHFYQQLSSDLMVAANRNPRQKFLNFPALIAKIISQKTNLFTLLAELYRKGDRHAIRDICCGELAALFQNYQELWHFHRNNWFEKNKPFGWEVIEARYGGMLARIETTIDRLTKWCENQIDRIPELEEILQEPWEIKDACFPSVAHARLKTPSVIK